MYDPLATEAVAAQRDGDPVVWGGLHRSGGPYEQIFA
ncbi:acyl CoA:acetate/3-ketoacid CoA transferase alpha subunit [Planotetraspora sp. GP83]